MSRQDNPPSSPVAPNLGPHSIVPASTEASPISVPADRIYRIAALTAGIFLLATLL
ncbi:MAG TPA: hypothetical protein VK627_00105 [Edaphobacter sp.]|jgi:hypothetical protein|nr:hypothetical protein [Edaphobacter sp.]